MGLRRQLKKRYKFNKSMMKPVANTQPLTWAILSNDLKAYKRFFSDQGKFGEMHKKVEEAFKWTTSSTLEGENKVLEIFLRELKKLVPKEHYDKCMKAFDDAKALCLEKIRETQGTESTFISRVKQSPRKKYRVHINEVYLTELVKTKAFLLKGKPNWSAIGRELHVDADCAKNRWKDMQNSERNSE